MNILLLSLYLLFFVTLYYASNTYKNSVVIGPRESKHFRDILIALFSIDFAYTSIVLIQASREYWPIAILLLGNICYIIYFMYHYLQNPLKSNSSNYKLIIYHFFMIVILYYCSLLLFSPLLNLYIILIIVFTTIRFRYMNSKIGLYKM